jgi:hypothetical protein
MTDSTASTNESMIWCAKTGELQSLKILLKEVRMNDLKMFFVLSCFVFFSIQEKSMNK